MGFKVRDSSFTWQIWIHQFALRRDSLKACKCKWKNSLGLNRQSLSLRSANKEKSLIERTLDVDFERRKTCNLQNCNSVYGKKASRELGKGLQISLFESWELSSGRKLEGSLKFKTSGSSYILFGIRTNVTSTSFEGQARSIGASEVIKKSLVGGQRLSEPKMRATNPVTY